MGEKDLVIFIVGMSIAILLLLTTVVLFVFQYRKRQIIYRNEVERINEKHRLEVLEAQVESQKLTMEELGKELHDNIGQKITLASIYLQNEAYDNSKINSMLNEVLAELRLLSKTLVHDEYQSQDLHELIKNEIANVLFATNIKISHEITPINKDISIQLKSTYVRVLQEFIQNSIKHSECTEIKVTLNEKDNKLILECEDNGKGFNINKEVPGIGITNMKRRASHLGAEINIESILGRGVKMNFSTSI